MELIVVIAVLGILASIAVPRYVGYTTAAQNSVDEANARILTNVANVHHTQTGSFPAWTSPFTTLDASTTLYLNEDDEIQNIANEFVYDFSTGTVTVNSSGGGIIVSPPVAPSNDAALSSLTVGGVTVSLSPGVTSYTIELPHGTSIPPAVNAVKNDPGAIVGSPSHSSDRIELVVTAQDTTTILTYTVNYTIAAALGPTDDEIIQTVLNNITSLSVSNPNATNPQINVSSSVSGVTFKFTNSSITGGASITIGGGGTYATVGRNNNQNRTGTITMQASLNGKNMIKAFSVSIPSNSSLGTVTVTQ